MKLKSLWLVAAVIVYLSVTGYQCGSAEATSAKLYIKSKEWDAAEAALMKEVESAPDNAEAWYLLGHVRLQKAEVALKEKNYEQVSTNVKNMADAYAKSWAASEEYRPQVSTERLYIWQKVLNAGVESFNESIQAPEEGKAALRDRAVAMYDAAIVVVPDSVLPYKNAAISLQYDANIDRQLPYLQKAKELAPDIETSMSLIRYHMTKGDNATAAKDSAGAVKHYNDAIEELKVARKLDPANAELMNAMIDLSIKTGRTAEAITLMEEGLAADPANRDYNYNIGVLYSGTGQTEKAISHFETALKTDPAHGPSLQNLGAAHFKKGDELKKAAQSDPTGNADKSVYVAEFKKAAGYFEQLTKIQPENGNVWEILGSAYANAGMIKEAQDAISKADSLRK